MPGLEIAELAQMRTDGYRVCPNVRHENITLWSSSWRLKFIHSQFPLPMALNSVLLKCQTET